MTRRKLAIVSLPILASVFIAVGVHAANQPSTPLYQVQGSGVQVQGSQPILQGSSDQLQPAISNQQLYSL